MPDLVSSIEDDRMNAEIIAIGTELTSGAKLDTNTQWLSEQLSDLGIPVQFHTTVADDLDANVEVLKIAAGRADIVLITGGLGPTRDDLTREAMAALAEAELELDEPSLAHIESFFHERGIPMPERNRVQAMFPRGSEPLPNPIGTAPGIWQQLPRDGKPACRLAAFPGVPSEMKRMFFEQVRPKLTGNGRVIRRFRINCFGIGESATEELLGELTARGHDPEIGITAHEATITLRIIAVSDSVEDCRRKIDEASADIRARLGDYVFGIEDEELEEVVVRELNARRETFATVEWATAGGLAQRIASIPDAVRCYRGGGVVTTEEDYLDAIEHFTSTKPVDYLLCIGAEFFEQEGERPV